jgi:hypothetical protein
MGTSLVAQLWAQLSFTIHGGSLPGTARRTLAAAGTMTMTTSAGTRVLQVRGQADG